MRRTTQHRGLHRAYLAILGGATLIALIAAAFATTLVGTSSAATTVAPNNTAEPRITGEPRVGQVQRANRGTWTGTAPISYEYRWYRCDGAEPPTHPTVRGSRTRATTPTSRVRAIPASGFASRSSAETPMARTRRPRIRRAVISSAGPTNRTEPSITGTATVGSTLQANRGEWSGQQPITYSYAWLRCTAQGDNCSEIQGANDTEYEVRSGDSGRTLRVRVTARNDRGQNSAISNPTGVVGGGNTASALRHLAPRFRSGI